MTCRDRADRARRHDLPAAAEGDLVARPWPASRLGFVLPQVFLGRGAIDLSEIRVVAERADDAGLHSLWTQSQVVGDADVLEPLTLLSYIAALTRRIALGTAVLNAPEHNPLQLAKQFSSLDNLSAGRTIVGLGIGSPRHAFEMKGLAMDRRVRRLLETLGVFRALWTEDPASFDGEIWGFDGLSMNPKPVQRPHPPIWLSGRHPNSLRRAVRHGDGWIGPGAASIDEFAQIMGDLERALDEAGRDRETFTIAKRVYLAVEDTRERAAERLRERFAAYSGNPERATVASVYGSLDDVAEGVARVFELGADLVVLNPVYAAVDQQEALLGLVARS